MLKVFKYPLAVVEDQTVMLPHHAKLLKVAQQGPDLQLWALVRPGAIQEPRYLKIVGTGHSLSTDFNYEHISTILVTNGLVLHVFEQLDELL